MKTCHKGNRRIGGRQGREFGLAASFIAVALSGACAGHSSSPGGAAGAGGSPFAGSTGQGGTLGTGGMVGTGGSSGSGLAGSTVAGSTELPLLDQPLPTTYTCAATRPVTISSVKAQEGTLGAPLALGAQIAFVVRSFFPGSADLANGVYASTLSLDGSIAAPVPVRVATSYQLQPRMIRQDNRTTVVWLEPGAVSTEIWTAQIDDSNAVVGPARSRYSVPVDVAVGHLLMAKQATELRLFWDESDSGSGTASVKTVALSSEGDFLSTPTSVLNLTATIFALSDVVPFAGGYAVSFLAGDSAAVTLRYLTIDAALAPAHQVVDLGAIGFSGWGDPGRLFARDSELIIAKVAATGSYENSNIARFIELSRYDRAGIRLSGPTLLKRPVEDVELVSPRFLGIGDDIGLLWSEGSVIYVCAGCTPNNGLNFVVLDGASLRPKSKVVTFPSPEAHGGLVSAEMASANGETSVVTAVQYHTTSSLASGRLTCSP